MSDGAAATHGRDLGDDHAPLRARSPVGDRWAVIVGISDYADTKLTLQYAHADALALRDFLLTPAGGAFAPERIKLLVNKKATTRAVTSAMRSFLAQTKEDDFVLISVACHGAPDERGVGQPLYLLTHDTDLDDIAATAVPMDEVAWCLKNYVRARRIVMLADTCHSGGIASGARGGELSAAALNRYLEQLSTTTPGVAYLTSARENQRSYEGSQWGDGHGVFTWFVLEGMRGAADGYGGRPKDGVVSLGELADYVTDRVFAETNRSQQPVLGGGRYDLELPMAVAGGLDVEQHVATARALMEVGWLLDDPAPFRCAAREAGLATELAALTGAALPVATCLEGEALLAAGDAGGAARRLDEALRRFGDEVPPETWLHLGIARAALAEHEPAADALGRFVREAPGSRDAVWAGDYETWLRDPGGRARALVIAVGVHELSTIPRLDGPKNDAPLMRDFLVTRLGLADEDVSVLVDAAATRTAVVDALARLAATSTERDAVLIYFSGHSIGQAREDQVYLALHDVPRGEVAGLTPAELHRLVAGIPARARVLLLDADGNDALNHLVARDRLANAMAATDTGSFANERRVNGTTFGAFTYALVQTWAADDDPQTVALGEIVSKIHEHLQVHDPRPRFVGDPNASVFAGAFPAADLWRAAQLRTPATGSPRLLAVCGDGRWPRGQGLRGRALAAGGQYGAALELLQAVAGDEGATGWLDVARVAVDAERWDLVLEALAQFEALPASRRWDASPAAARLAVDRLRESRPRALLAGISSHADASLPRAEGAANDVATFRPLLAQHGFDDAEITVLEVADATRDRIVAEFKSLAAHGREQLVVFYLAGNGSRTAAGEPTIVPYDGRAGGAADLTLRELADEARHSLNLVMVLDAGCGYTWEEEGSRCIALAETPAPRDIALPAPGPWIPPELVIGGATIAANIPGPVGTGGSTTREHRIDGEVKGLLTSALVMHHTGATYDQWVAAVDKDLPALGVTVAGPAAAELVFRHRTRWAALADALGALQAAPAARAVELVQRQAARLEDRNEQSPPVYLELGLSYAALGKPREATRFFRTARNLYEDPTIRAQEEARDPYVKVWDREASYHLGRLLYQDTEAAGELTEAVASLRRAHEQAADDPRIWLHLALAIRALVERQSLIEVADLLHAYLAAGAPLGRVEDVQSALAAPPTAGAAMDEGTESG